MDILLLGTAAAEGWPAPWCRCTHCENARRRGGPNLRSRSGALLDNDLKIDYNADTLLQMQRTGRCLADVRTLVFTHQHVDHLAPDEFWIAPPGSQTPPSEPIAVYGSEEVLDVISARCTPTVLELFELHTLQPFQAVTLNSGDELLPLPADHEKGTLLLRLTRRGRTIFYGHDSGIYLEETVAALEAGPPLDAILLDATVGGIVPFHNRGHMNVEGVVQVVHELKSRAVITSQTRVIATHFSHNGGLLHEELIHYFLPHCIEVAFDGMVINLPDLT